ncbi:MAG: translation initiation factor IF-3 [Chloroflexi bacterium]|nr:translation initiation factor IF-3 [Chloroflexota bacterium]
MHRAFQRRPPAGVRGILHRGQSVPSSQQFPGFDAGEQRIPLIAREYRINRQIRVPEVRIIEDDDGTPVVLSIQDALALAEERGLDLVEVAPNQTPPVCKLLDYGRFKFVQSKRAREAKRSQAKNELREVRLSMKIGEHDLLSKIRRARELLRGGAKVKVTVRFRGREIAHPDLAVKLLRRAAEALADGAKLERAPMMEARSLSIILAPDEVAIAAGARASAASAASASGASNGSTEN